MSAAERNVALTESVFSGGNQRDAEAQSYCATVKIRLNVPLTKVVQRKSSRTQPFHAAFVVGY